MKYSYFVLIMLWLSFSTKNSFAQEIEPGILLEKTVVIDDSVRAFLFYVPSAYDGSEAWPLVFNLHGGSSNAYQHMAVSGMNAIADTAHFLIAYPEGINNGTGVTGWNESGLPWIQDDVKFLSESIDSISSEYNVDSSKVYFTGYSNGGGMSLTLACTLGEKVAAIASVAAAGTYEPCNPIRPMPILYMHGTADIVAPYYGGQSAVFPLVFPSAREKVDYWLAKNECSAEATITEVPDTVLYDSSSVIIEQYKFCDSSAEYLFYTIENGGHTWPGGPPSPPALAFLGNVNQDINASSEIWNFFSKHQLPDIENLPTIEDFYLIDAKADVELMPLYDYATINLATLESDKLSIVAETTDKIGSVKLELAGPIDFKRIESYAPYALFGDVNGNYKGEKLPKGTYTLKATPYDEPTAKGISGLRKYLTFYIENDTIITGFELIDSQSDTVLMAVNDGDVIDLSNTGNQLNIKANIYPQKVGSVKFEFDGIAKIENVMPYALFGDTNADYLGKEIAVGSHTLSAMAYTKPQAKGDLVASYAISFEVIEGSSYKKISNRLYQNEPNPSTGSTSIRAFIKEDIITAKLLIIDNMGELVKEIEIKNRGEITINPQLNNLKKGIYIYKLITSDSSSDVKRLMIID
ncbi:MAG: hypothetical protein CMO01_25950 [Thalassobius sp.]|nr:hypothetical protein [Thalassovita sp.]